MKVRTRERTAFRRTLGPDFGERMIEINQHHHASFRGHAGEGDESDRCHARV